MDEDISASKIISIITNKNGASIHYIKSYLLKIFIKLYLTDEDKLSTFITYLNNICLAIDLSVQKNISFDESISFSKTDLATFENFEIKDKKLYFLGRSIEYFETFCSKKMVSSGYAVQSILNLYKNNEGPYLKNLNILESSEYISLTTYRVNGTFIKYYYKVSIIDKDKEFKEPLTLALECDSIGEEEAECTKHSIYYASYKDKNKNKINILSLSTWAIYEFHPVFGKHAFLEFWCKNDDNEFYGIGHYSLNPYLSILFSLEITNVYLEVSVNKTNEMNDFALTDTKNNTLNIYKKMGFTAVCYVQETYKGLDDTIDDTIDEESWYLLMHLKITPELLIKQVFRDVTLKKINQIK